MRTKVVLLALALSLFLSLPVAGWADPISYQYTGGTVTSNGSALSLASSRVSGGGSLSFATGPLVSGTLAAGAVLGAGGSVTITAPNSTGAPATVFTGTFSGPVAWTTNWVSTAGPNGQGAWYYTLSGAVHGTLSNGQSVSGTLNVSTNDVPNGHSFLSFVNVNQGVLTFSVPEPGTMTLLGTGLVWLLGVVRRRSS